MRIKEEEEEEEEEEDDWKWRTVAYDTSLISSSQRVSYSSTL